MIKMTNSFSNLENNVHCDRNVITFKKEIRVTDVETYLNRHLCDFPKNSRFVVFCGIHTTQAGELSSSHSKFVADYQAMFDRIIEYWEKPCEKQCQQCLQCQNYSQNHHLWMEKNFEKGLGIVIPLFSIKNKHGNYCLLRSAKNSLRMKFEELIESQEPYVLIFASCYSYRSKIKHILRSSGLISAVMTSADQGDITNGNFFQLDKDQKKFLNEIANDCELKDVIIFGE